MNPDPKRWLQLSISIGKKVNQNIFKIYIFSHIFSLIPREGNTDILSEKDSSKWYKTKRFSKKNFSCGPILWITEFGFLEDAGTGSNPNMVKNCRLVLFLKKIISFHVLGDSAYVPYQVP